MTKINFISIAPQYTGGSFTAAFFDDHVEVHQWACQHPEEKYDLYFADVIKEFVDKGASFVFTSTEQCDMLRGKDKVQLTRLPDIKKEN